MPGRMIRPAARGSATAADKLDGRNTALSKIDDIRVVAPRRLAAARERARNLPTSSRRPHPCTVVAGQTRSHAQQQAAMIHVGAETAIGLILLDVERQGIGRWGR